MQTIFSHGPRATFGRVRSLARLRLPSFSSQRDEQATILTQLAGNTILDGIQRLPSVLDDMKIALVRLQLRQRHVLNGERVVGSVCDYDVAVIVVVSGRHYFVGICKDRAAELNVVRCYR